jgi:hypothetical protein
VREKSLEKQDFKEHTRYTITLRDEHDRMHAENIYIYRLYRDFMIARLLDASGLLQKLRYADVTKIVKTTEVPRSRRFLLPDAVLAEANWTDRSTMQIYSSSPALGK